MDEVKAYCKEQFERIERRLNSKSDIIDKHETEIEVIKSDMKHLTNSLNALTKALWGVTATAIASLFGFFIWYIQNL